MKQAYAERGYPYHPPASRPFLPALCALVAVVVVIWLFASKRKTEAKQPPAKPVVVPLTEQQERALEADILRKVKIDHEAIRRQLPRPEMVQ